MISKVKLGRDFEKEAYEHLNKLFDEVIWLSEKHQSRYDFIYLKDGRTYYAEAKCSETMSKPILKDNQIDAEIIIFKGKSGKVEVIEKKDFDKKVNILKTYENKKINWSNKKIGIGVVNGIKNTSGICIEINPIYAQVNKIKNGQEIDIENLNLMEMEK